MTNNKKFENISSRWAEYLNKKFNIIKATCMKILFKIFYY